MTHACKAVSTLQSNPTCFRPLSNCLPKSAITRPPLASYLSCSSAIASGGAAVTPEARSSERAIQPLQPPRQRFHLAFTTVHNGVSLQHAATFLSSTSADLKRHRQAWHRGATARHGQELGHRPIHRVKPCQLTQLSVHKTRKVTCAHRGKHSV